MQFAAIFAGDPDVADLMDEQAFDQFDAMCTRHDIAPPQLLDLNDATLETWMREVLSEKQQRGGVVAEKVRPFIRRYVEACA